MTIDIEKADKGLILDCSNFPTDSWHGWYNLMPPGPPWLYITGRMETNNLGVSGILVKRVPQGINEKILLLVLVVVQAPGRWPQVISKVPVKYSEPAEGQGYEKFEVYCKDKVIGSGDIEIAS